MLHERRSLADTAGGFVGPAITDRETSARLAPLFQLVLVLH